MSLSDCRKCWDTPCHCGYEYRRLSKVDRAALAAAVLGVPDRGPLFEKLLAIAPRDHPKKDEA